MLDFLLLRSYKNSSGMSGKKQKICNPMNNHHGMKSVNIQSYSGSYFPAFGLNTERYTGSLRIKSECGKMQTRITPNTETFSPVDTAKNSLWHPYF